MKGHQGWGLPEIYSFYTWWTESFKSQVIKEDLKLKLIA